MSLPASSRRSRFFCIPTQLELIDSFTPYYVQVLHEDAEDAEDLFFEHLYLVYFDHFPFQIPDVVRYNKALARRKVVSFTHFRHNIS
jgi:hypothetical protein